MSHKNFYILNGLVWKILSVDERKFFIGRKGTIERHLKNNNIDDWLIEHKEYYVTVKRKEESFERIFVIEEQEAIKHILQ